VLIGTQCIFHFWVLADARKLSYCLKEMFVQLSGAAAPSSYTYAHDQEISRQTNKAKTGMDVFIYLHYHAVKITEMRL